ncbi:DNA methylase [Streptomyces phage TuanPN]|nr:DNA methylase [Streptomyces phage TuanPN]USH46057.1 DNA methyltransferase [Streptomyces phage Ejemplo]
MARKRTNDDLNRLYYGDNLDVLRQNIADESVDLVYLDPPFNSNRAYSVLFKEKSGDDSQAQMEAFDDTWTWTHESEALYMELMQSNATPNKVRDALEAMRRLLGDNDVLAYMVMMAARLLELHRVLKPHGSLYLHCDPTASHYLKIMLDAIFGAVGFRSEVVWKRYGAHSNSTGYGAVHDILLYYVKGTLADATFNKQFVPYEDAYVQQRFRYSDPDGRRYREQNLANPALRPNLQYDFTGKNGITYKSPPNGWKYTRERMQELDDQDRLHYPARANGRLAMKNYLDEAKGVPVQDVWTDIPSLGGTSPERLGYPTQKPTPLLERVILTSSNEGDVVLDPFCGCGTAVDAAQKLGRRWIGIDVTTLAVDLIDARLRHTYGEQITQTYEILGIPRDIAGARALFQRSPFEFERWCVMMLDGQPNEKQVGDRGIDGVIRFPVDAKGGSDRVLVSVKGGATNPGHVRDLLGTVESQRAAMGVFVCMIEPTKGMVDAANHSGAYNHPANGQRYPKVQIITVKDLINGKRPNMPTALLPYFQAQRRYGEEQTEKLF